MTEEEREEASDLHDPGIDLREESSDLCVLIRMLNLFIHWDDSRMSEERGQRERRLSRDSREECT